MSTAEMVCSGDLTIGMNISREPLDELRIQAAQPPIYNSSMVLPRSYWLFLFPVNMAQRMVADII